MKFYFFILLLISSFCFSQAEVSLMYEELPEDSMPDGLRFHSSLKPFVGLPLKNDSILTLSYGDKSKFIPKGNLSPIFDLTYQANHKTATRTGFGVSFQSRELGKWFYRFSAIQGTGNSSQNARPKALLFDSIKNNGYVYTDIRGRVSYSPNHIFNFQAGIDNNFIGEGNRSMLLGDYGIPYPFAKIRTNFWRLEYNVLYQSFRETAEGQNWKSKFSTSHLISYNVFKWLNVGVFENIIFSPQDTNLNRGFDAEYLNPVIFYRPQEYSLGSSDNSLLGLQLAAKYKGHTLYGQFVLDDFILAEYRARTNWWGNKYGGQAGVKGRFKYDDKRYFYRLETNFARPYTYSHTSSDQNYANQGEVISHPLGANFIEFLGEVKVQKNKWVVKGFLSYYMKGENKIDEDGLVINYGGDIYHPYNDRPFEYGVITGQGVKVNYTHLMLGAEYLVSESNNLNFFIENHFRSNTLQTNTKYQFFIGLRSCLWNDYRNY